MPDIPALSSFLVPPPVAWIVPPARSPSQGLNVSPTEPPDWHSGGHSATHSTRSGPGNRSLFGARAWPACSQSRAHQWTSKRSQRSFPERHPLLPVRTPCKAWMHSVFFPAFADQPRELLEPHAVGLRSRHEAAVTQTRHPHVTHDFTAR